MSFVTQTRRQTASLLAVIMQHWQWAAVLSQTRHTVHKPWSIFKYPLPCRYVRVGLKVSQNMSCCGKYLTCWPHRPGEWRVVSRKWLQIVWRRQRAGDSFQFYKCSSETAGTAKPSVIDVRPTSRLNCFLNCVTNISKCEKVTILKSQFCSIASWSVQFCLPLP